jgi:hypothetical protein
MGIDTKRGVYAVTVPVTGPGAAKSLTGGVIRLYGWSLGDAGIPPVVDSLTAAVAAAAAGTLTLTGFLTVAQVVITPAAAWPAGVNQVTLTNVTGGTQTADIEGGTTNAVVMAFPLPVGTTGTPVVSVPAIVGGPAYTIEAEGTISGGVPQAGVASCQLLDGGQIVGVSAPLSGVSDTQWLADTGIEIGSAVSILVLAGAVSGCIYVADVDPRVSNA